MMVSLRTRRVRVGLTCGLLVAAAGIGLPGRVVAQANCSTQNNVYACDIPAGTYSAPVIASEPVESVVLGQGMAVISAGVITIPSSAPATTSWGVSALAVTSSGYGFPEDGDTYGLAISNQGALTLTPDLSSPVDSYIFGLLALQSAVSTGASQVGVTLDNAGAITMDLAGVQVWGGSAIWASDQGGPSGGSSAGVSVTNSGAITATATGQQGFAGIQANSWGGYLGASGSGGAASIVNAAPVTVNWTWENVGNANNGVLGLQALSQGSNGGDNDDGYGGNGGGAGSASVTLNAGGDVTVGVSGSPPGSSALSAGVLAAVIGGSGGAGAGGSSYGGGNGAGLGELAEISVNGADVQTTGDLLPGLSLLMLAGAGGNGGCQNNTGCDFSDTSGDETGGYGGQVVGGATIAVSALLGPVTLSTTGAQSAAIQALLVGGLGGAGGDDVTVGGGTGAGGLGGGGGAVLGQIGIALTGAGSNGVAVSTAGSSSPGILAGSFGGSGGQGGDISTEFADVTGGGGGPGGTGGDIAVSLASAAIATQGTSAPGVVAQSVGGTGAAGGDGDGSIGSATGGAGGSGGNGGNVTVTLDNLSTIATQGTDSLGILAQSLSGAGGSGGQSNALASDAGPGGSGGNAGNVSVENDGSITTAGATARGILVQSLAGTGGAGGTSWGFFHSGGGSGASAGTVGSVSVTNDGSIVTSGSNAQGVLLQSIGGSGGAGGQASGLIDTLGGDADSNPFTSDGNSVNFASTGGTIATSGIASFGVLGQSIGGGGGDGGGASGVAVTVGGSGGAGGAGGAATATVAAGSQFLTTGDGSAALVMQSIGGGGGNAGNASSEGLFASVAIGGSGGDGGDGGTVSIAADGASITTSGSQAPGLIAQSIGGGGGTGGQALAGSIGAGFSAAVAIGGSGGNGGDGGIATVTVADSRIATGQDSLLVNDVGSATSPCAALPCSGLPIDSHGAVVQSIGGGGGLGGSALATSVAIAIPVTPNGDQVGVAASVALGGSGGNGGDGGTAAFALSDGGEITASGQGSKGVLLQSIGGGGGAGGDSSALAAVLGYDGTAPEGATSLAVTATYEVGGSGGSGGAGGDVLAAIGGTIAGSIATADAAGSATADAAGSAPTSIVTYGDYGNGMTAQSIGGGGGDAGFGSGNTQSFGTGSSTSLSVTLGSTGGIGGAGGAVDAYLFSGDGITTYGSGALGLLAQSVGGGGGTSQGGSISFAETIGSPSGESVKPGINVGFGTTGVGGGDGGDVTVSVAAPITTFGGDATGVLAQSVGGGGGLGGSAGSDASADNPIVAAFAAREGLSNINSLLNDGNLPQIDGTFSLSFGGTGGSGGDGGDVSIDLSAPVATAGDWANGIFAQSVGGGGGKGGTAAASGTGGLPEITINVDMALGGAGGAGGDGGSVTVNLDQGETAIRTAGYGAAALLAQSVGGGGGFGADGSDSAMGLISVGAGSGGAGGSAGDGGAVVLNYGNTPGTTIATGGDAADAILLQSVGGGGGIAGAGSSAFVSAFRLSGETFALSAGGGLSAGGNGGDVTLQASFSDDNALSIATAGAYAFGILAQSVGGGGGLVTVQPSTGSVTTEIGGTLASGSGGAVDVIANDVAITTSGLAAVGILAQSVGGGGGIVRVADTEAISPSLTTLGSGGSESVDPGSGNGGAVTVYVDNGGSVAVNGAGAIGVLAQSIGGGGGVVINDNSIFAGAPNAADFPDCLGCGVGGSVSVTVDGPVSSTGDNGIGVFAQSQGYGTNGPITVTVNSSLTGGAGTPATPSQPGASGVQFDGGTANALIVNGTLSSIAGSDGTAVLATSGSVSITNNGTITGSVYAGGTLDRVAATFRLLSEEGILAGASAATEASGPAQAMLDNRGVFNAGAMMQGTLVNSGVVNVGLGDEVRTTTVTEDFTQTSTGRLAVTIDSLNHGADRVEVGGAALIEGVIVPRAITLLPGSLAVVTADRLVSTADGVDSLLFRWDAEASGNALLLAPHSNFRPASLDLTASQASMADYYERAWNNADPAFAGHFARLSQVAALQDYTAAMDEYSSKDIYAPSIALASSMGTVLNSSMNCPVFADRGVRLDQDECLWLSGTGRWTHQDGSRDIQAYDVSSTSYRIGGQHAIAPDLYLGGSLAYTETSATMEGGSSGDGTSFDGSVSLTRTFGPWLFAGSVALAEGSYAVGRQLNVPGFEAALSSDPSIFLAAARVRAGYEFGFDGWYLRPYGDLDVIYSNMPGLQESGTSPYALDIDSSIETDIALALMVEIGGRIELDRETSLRPFGSFGVNYMPDHTWEAQANFASDTAANGTFSDYLDLPELLARVDLGLQFYHAERIEVTAGYTADIGDSYVSQSATARFAYHF